ncbi:hypothetical protein KAJ27_11370 [bacterium]|nr:hypothetical protein [bacterium]
MKTCKNCNKINSDSREHCFQCNEPLHTETVDQLTSSDSNALLYAKGFSLGICMGMLPLLFGALFMNFEEYQFSFSTGASISYILLSIIVYFYERKSKSKIIFFTAITCGLIMVIIYILYMG